MKMFPLLLFVSLVHIHPLKQPIGEAGLVRFNILNAGLDVEGSLNIVRAEIRLDPDNLKESFIHAVGDPASIETGIAIRDKHLKRSDYFDVARYPNIQLESTGFKANGRLKYIGEFDLTIKGMTKSIAIPFSLKKENNTLTYEARFQINRLDFGLGEPSAILDDIVTISVRIQK